MTKEEIKSVVNLCLSSNRNDHELAKNIIKASKVTIEDLKEFALIELLFLMDDMDSKFNSLGDNLLYALGSKFRSIKSYSKTFLPFTEEEMKKITRRRFD